MSETRTVCFIDVSILVKKIITAKEFEKFLPEVSTMDLRFFSNQVIEPIWGIRKDSVWEKGESFPKLPKADRHNSDCNSVVRYFHQYKDLHKWQKLILATDKTSKRNRAGLYFLKSQSLRNKLFCKEVIWLLPENTQTIKKDIFLECYDQVIFWDKK